MIYLLLIIIKEEIWYFVLVTWIEKGGQDIIHILSSLLITDSLKAMSSNSYTRFSVLVLSRPDGLEETLLGGQATKRVVGFRSETDGSSEGEGNGFTGETAFSVDFSNV